MTQEHTARQDETLAIYEWQAWEKFLLSSMFPKAWRVPVRIGEDYAEVVSKVQSSVKRFIFHIGLTECSRVPLGRQMLIKRLNQDGIMVVNGEVTDISKRKIQSACLACELPSTMALRDGDPDELVILKTNRNYGGEHERRLRSNECRFLGLRTVTHPVISDALSYKICKRKETPPHLWDDTDIIIERFISNKSNAFFRAYIFLRRMIIEAAISRAPIKKMSPGLPRRQFYFVFPAFGEVPIDNGSLSISKLPASLPCSIRKFCQHFRLQFGAVDVVLDDGEDCYVVDANSTPYWGRPGGREMLSFLRESLSEASFD